MYVILCLRDKLRGGTYLFPETGGLEIDCVSEKCCRIGLLADPSVGGGGITRKYAKTFFKRVLHRVKTLLYFIFKGVL